MINSFETKVNRKRRGRDSHPQCSYAQRFSGPFPHLAGSAPKTRLKKFSFFFIFQEATLIEEEIENFQNKRKLYMKYGLK
jgi:hypothetical protein